MLLLFLILIVRQKYGGRVENLTKCFGCNWNWILGWDFGPKNLRGLWGGWTIPWVDQKDQSKP